MFNKLLAVTFLYGSIFTWQACAQDRVPAAFGAADTLRISFSQAERVFLDSNLELVAAYYNVQSGKALEEQARKWDNPLLVTDQNIYAGNKFFSHRKDPNGNIDGQVFVQVQQLIKTAGKRGKQLDIARTTTAINLWQFRELLRTLRFRLAVDYYTLAKLQQEGNLYTQNLARLSQLAVVMQQQYQSGNIALKENLRVQSLVISLTTTITENATAQLDMVNELKTLLQIKDNVFIVATEPLVTGTQPSALNISGLMDSAVKHNTDYNLQMEQLQYSRQNVLLQRALAVPDLTAGVEYDQNSNYTPNYYGLTLNIPIPILDRNKGNIKAANWQAKQEEVKATQVYTKLQNDIISSYSKYQVISNIASPANDSFYNDYQRLFYNIAESYNKRQISLVEFLTYFSDYQSIKTAQLNTRLNLTLSKLEFNDLIGVDILK